MIERDRQDACELAESISLLCCESDVDKIVRFASRVRADERATLHGLLRAAVCPMKAQGCDGRGYPVQVQADNADGWDYEQEQCQWLRRAKESP